MTNTDELMVIDGHSIDFDKKEFPRLNDIREIYDINLTKSIDTCKTSLVTREEDYNSKKNVWSINVNISDREIVQIEENIYEIISGPDGLSLKLYGKNGTIFEFTTNSDFKLDEEKYGKSIDVTDNSNLCHYTNGDTSVISNDLTNRIIKYSSSENINNHIYTKYYEFIDSMDIAVYILLIDFTPFRNIMNGTLKIWAVKWGQR